MSITGIQIRNFRSIRQADLRTHALNIFVGQNDDGKSNVLRALDLFFNHDKDDGYSLDWMQDFCSFAIKRKGKADEIAIQLEVTPPASFSKQDPVIWRKVWRQFGGLHQDAFGYRDGSEVSPKSKIAALLRAMRYDYVPAIKGEDYFRRLMTKLHDMLEATVEQQIHDASGQFTDTINENTKTILSEIQRRLNLQTTIQLPANLRELFSQLEFTSMSGERPFSLRQRGDGIKVRHIPIVLRWLSEQANHLSERGRPKTVTVWGYEEPENNLELRRCYDLAEEFIASADDIQAFVTTHSPAFYSVFRDRAADRVGLFLVTKGAAQPVTDVRPLAEGDLFELDSSMGLLALLEPHMREARTELDALRVNIRRLRDTSVPTIFCEGPSDRTIYQATMRVFFPNHAASTMVMCSTDHGGGHAWVCDSLIAWSHSRPTARAVGVFDKDDEAKLSRTRAEAAMKIPGSGKKAFCVLVKPGESLRACYSRRIPIPFAIEELYPADIWELAEGRRWLEDRPLVIDLYRFDRRDVTFDDFLAERLPETHLHQMATKRVRIESKVALANHVAAIADETEMRRVLLDVEPTVRECLDKLGVL